jgi:hypothetical protein
MIEKQFKFALFVREYAAALGSRPGPGRPSTKPTPPAEVIEWIDSALRVPPELLPDDLAEAAGQFVSGRQPQVLVDELAPWLLEAYRYAFPSVRR